ncbi:hypothetical protein ACERK3_10670 [Phycisphaerales bacterium AB-hyl4]|uniref:Uncharacterized protein n=1 Tax=Natronomicrosphaera hydrolytica TaxID=3242702 RepID=A0ABV4U584_9BACT
MYVKRPCFLSANMTAVALLIAMLCSIVHAQVLVASEAAAAPSSTGRAWLTESYLHVAIGEYEARFAKASAWTLAAVSYRGEELLNETGAYQSVLNVEVEKTGDERPDPWIGTGHGKEVVVSLSLEVDGEPYALSEHETGPWERSGRSFTLVKESDLGPYRHTARVELNENGLSEDMHFEFQGPEMSINFMYVFMHCFGKQLEQWYVERADGQRQHGTFLSDNSFSLRRDIRWAAMYAPELKMGVVYAYPEAYAGDPPDRNFFWNRPHHSKLYLRVMPPQGEGVSFSYRVRLSGFEASNDDWNAVAERLAAELAEKK